MSYNFKTIEKKWQKQWEQEKCFEVKADSKFPKFYNLEMFPYPSGEGLHMGHALNYTIGDILARFKRMIGFNVLYPMGYDSFGLPAENAAIKAKTHPRKYTKNAIKNFIKQQKALGLSYDWSKILSSCEPEYYKWNQFWFLKFLEKGLVYRKKAPVNWCPKCETVLANEQVHNGKCWRHNDTDVETKPLEQWFIKTTDYAEELLDKVDDLKWPQRIKTMQKNWIGKSFGTEIDFEVETPKNNGSEKISNVVIVHGSPDDDEPRTPEGRSYDKHWQPWMKEQLEKNGIKCDTPLMPEPWNPKYSEWKKVFEKNKIDENSVLIGHSSGTAFLIRWLGETKKKIKKLILVASWKESWRDSPENKEFCDFEVDKSLCEKVDEIIIFTSDYPDERKRADFFNKNLFSKLIELKGRGHFIEKHMKTKEFPELLKEIISLKKNFSFPIFTTRPDTIFGVTFMVISAQHQKLMKLVTSEQKKDVEKFLKKIKSISEKDKSDLEKEGVFTGSYAINPMTKDKIPIYVGNFVVADYGSGMVMAVPAHDQRDFLFAEKYGIEIKQVIEGDLKERAYTEKGKLINSGDFTGIENEEAKKKITDYLIKKKLGRKKIQYKLKDWLVSRQRYWGTPIPVVYCESCKQDVEKNSLTINFYDQNNFNRIKFGEKIIETRALNPNEKERYFGDLKKGNYLKCVNKNTGEVIYLEIMNVKKFKNLKEAFEDKIFINKFSKKINSIKDLENCYKFTENYLERINKNGLVAWDIELITPGIVPVPGNELPVKLPEKVEFGKGNPLITNEKFVNVKCPKCGSKATRETDTMDTFFDSSWYYLRFPDNKNSKKSFDKKKIDYWMPIDQYIGGAEHACMHLIYARFFTKALRDLGFLKFDEPFTNLFNQGMLHASDGNKMSKSLGNVINPLTVIEKYGADALRLSLMSFASPDSDTNWDEKVLIGSFKFINRVYEKFENIKIGKSEAKIVSKLNKAIKEITNQIGNFKYNLAIIKIRDLFNSLGEEESKEVLEKSLKLLHPICPHITEEIWTKLGNKDLISLSDWPKADEKKIDESLEKTEEAVEKLITDINHVGKLVGGKTRAYVYVLPNEKENFVNELFEIKKRTNLEVEIFAVNDKNKYDPENKSKKVKSNRPGIYLE